MGPVSAHATTTTNAALTADSSYVSVTPYRVADTRTSTPLAGGATLNVQVTGGASGVPAGAVAAVLNVTAVDPTAAGYLTVFPEGTTRPTVSNLNFAAGTTVPNLVTVALSASGGMVSIYLNTGSSNVLVDVEGYYATPVTTSGLYNPLSPSRAFGSLPIGGAIGAGVTTAVTVVGGTTGVPTTASAVVLNVTAAHATLPSFLTVFPAGKTRPTASNLNFGAQAPLQAIANRVTVGVGTSGQIEVYNLTGTVNVDVDVDGYYSGTGGVGSPFVAITPIRVADTVTANKVGSETPIPAPPPQAAATETFTLATPDIPANSAGVAMNLTVVPGNKPGYLTSYPTSTATPPVASDVNWTASESPAVPNFTIADTAGTGAAQNVKVANSYFTTGATVDVIADDFGYFAPSTAPVDTLAVTANPATILDNGTARSTITATVTNSGGPVVADPVTLALTGTCGSSSPASVSTSATGVATFTYTASTTVGICTVTATEGEQGASGKATVDQTPVTPTTLISVSTASSGAGELAEGDVLQVTFNQTASLTAAAFSLTLSDGTNEGTINNANATAVLSSNGLTVTYTITGTVVGTPTDPSLLNLEAVSQTGVSNAVGPWNLPGSANGGADPGVASASGESRVFNGSNSALINPALWIWVNSPNETVVAPSFSAIAGSSTVTVGFCPGTDALTVYNSNGVSLGTGTCVEPQGIGQVTLSSAPTAGEVLLVTQTYLNGYESIASEGTAAAPLTALPTTAIAAGPIGGAGNASGDTATWTGGGSGDYAVSLSDFATFSAGQVTVRPYTIVAATGGVGGVTAGDALAVFDGIYYVDLTTESPGPGGGDTAWVAIEFTNTGGTVSLTFGGSPDDNATATDTEYYPLATGTTGDPFSTGGWTPVAAQTLPITVVATGGALGTVSYDLTVTIP
jgi:hypothetical protein